MHRVDDDHVGSVCDRENGCVGGAYQIPKLASSRDLDDRLLAAYCVVSRIFTIDVDRAAAEHAEICRRQEDSRSPIARRESSVVEWQMRNILGAAESASLNCCQRCLSCGYREQIMKIRWTTAKEKGRHIQYIYIALVTGVDNQIE